MIWVMIRLASQEIYAVCENGGWIGVQACTASTYAEDDVNVNRETGGGLPPEVSQALDGQPWTEDKSLQVSPNQSCSDRPAEVNQTFLLRKVLRKAPGETLTCSEVNAFGQSVRYSYVKLIARLCPISVCGFNRYAFACRISCACADESLLTTGGERLCVRYEQLPRGYNIEAPLEEREFRCTGSGCRPLPFAPSALAYIIFVCATPRGGFF